MRRGGHGGARGRPLAACLLMLAVPAAALAQSDGNTPPPRPAQLGAQSPQAEEPPSPRSGGPGDTSALAGPPTDGPPTDGTAVATDRIVTPGQSATPAPLRVAPWGDGAGPTGMLAQAVLTVDQEAIYRQSAWGQRAERQIAEQSRKVAADNDRAFAALVADEDALTAARATLSPEEFRTRATAFDERVTAVRQERDAARMDLARMAERDRALFLKAAAPVLGQIMESRGALVVLDQRTVLISDPRVDVTAATVAALDGALGDGAGIVAAAREEEGAAPADPAPADPASARPAAADPVAADPAPGAPATAAPAQGAAP